MNLRFSSYLPLLALSSLFILSSCAVDENGHVIFNTEPAVTAQPLTVEAGSKYYSRGHHVFVNEAILDEVTPSNSRIEIDLSEQRARLYKTDGRRDKLALETQISTGKSSYPTPTGSFKVMEKAIAKESNLYGKWIDNGTGDVLVRDGDSREPPAGKDAKFSGAPMPYWLRLTSGGVGLHIGYVPSGPASHGCIRVPRAVQPTIYKKVRIGTPVTIVH